MNPIENTRRMIVRATSMLSSIGKSTYQVMTWRPGMKKKLLFVVGCQRSGTTLVQNILKRDRNAKIYPERSRLTSHDSQTGIRLNSLDDVKAELGRDLAPLIVLKPLVETQNVLALLQYFDGAKALFLYRHYEDVVASDLKRFGLESGMRNLLPIIRNESWNWRAEHVPEPVREIVARHFSETMQPYDAGALFWYVRNHLFFDLALFDYRSVWLCKYEALVREPMQVMRRIYYFGDVPFKLSARIVRNVHARSVGRGQGIRLSPEIRQICEELLQSLDEIYERQLERQQ